MRHLRHPIRYRLSEAADGKEWAKVKKELVETLEHAIALIIKEGLLDDIPAGPPAFVEMTPTTSVSTFLQPDEPLILDDSIFGDIKLHLPDGPRLFCGSSRPGMTGR